LYAADLADLSTLFGMRLARDGATADLGRVARAATYGAVQTVMVDIDRVVLGAAR